MAWLGHVGRTEDLLPKKLMCGVRKGGLIEEKVGYNMLRKICDQRVRATGRKKVSAENYHFIYQTP